MNILRLVLRFAPPVLAVWAIVLGAGAYGYMVSERQWFPHKQIGDTIQFAKDTHAGITGRAPWWHYHWTDRKPGSEAGPSAGMAPGLTMVTGYTKTAAFVRLLSPDRRVVHEWNIDWFDLKPEDVSYIPDSVLPRRRPGTTVHGMELSPEGDLTFNFEQLAMVQLDICGDLKWRLPIRTHHSLFLDDNGDLWTSQIIERTAPRPDLPNYEPPFFDYYVIRVSQDGKVLARYSVPEILERNGYHGLLYLDKSDDYSTETTGDTLHLNDVEVLSASMAPGIADAGDVMISLRDVNTIVIFDPDTLEIESVVSGQFVRQHDPDFVDGSTITVYDNNHVGERKNEKSRILKISLVDRSVDVIYEGGPGRPFYADIFGKHQALPTGGYLIVEATKGRVFEIDKNGEVIWEYLNYLEPGLLARVTGAVRVDPVMLDETRLAALKARCGNARTRQARSQAGPRHGLAAVEES